jgi:S-adenosylmethionine:diacylglycerol 3-amino-3-carboxypropyl transferase
MNSSVVNNNYREKSITPESVARDIGLIRERLGAVLHPDKQLTDFKDVLYLNSSDPLSALHEGLDDLSGCSVLSVAGSGEFAEVFLSKGASVVDSFDISSPTLFFSELRLAALRNCNYDEYRALFAKEDTLFDSDIYKILKNYLSPEAQAYFDELTKAENAKLFKKDVIGRRVPTAYGHIPSFIGDIISDKSVYEELQKKARAAQVNFHSEDVETLATKKNDSDITYLSNIPEITLNYGLISTFLRNGSKRVIFSLPAKEKGGKIELVSDEGTFLLNVGENFRMAGMKAGLLGYDKNIPFGALVEFRADNLHLHYADNFS